MPLTVRRVPTTVALPLLCAFAVLATLLTLSISQPGTSQASCVGSGCLPQGNYTLDTTYDCGAVGSNVACYANGTTIAGNAVYHHYGFLSASYSGSGSIHVAASAETSSGQGYFGGSGTNLVRTCYYDNCTPQTAVNLRAIVSQSSGVAHTVVGHAEA